MTTEPTRTCNRCHFTGPLDKFIKAKGYVLGRKPLCHTCHATYYRADYAEHRERYRASSRRWEEEHPGQSAQRASAWRAARKAKAI